MKIKWKHTMVMFILSASLVIPSAAFHVAADEKYTYSSSVTSYSLTDEIKVEVKSVLNESTPEGTRIGAVVRLFNNGDRLTGVPEYEVRVKTQDGLEYILRPSLANAKNIQPKETVELSYMNVVERYDVFALTELSFYDVDEFVYPKQEKRIISLPVSAIEWKGEKAVLTDPAALKKWEDSFKIPVLSDTLEFKPVSLNEQNTSDGAVTIATMLAVNTGDKKTAIPDFRLNGKSENKVYEAKRLEKDPIFLEPGEKNYLHYAIPIRNRADLKSLYVLTPEDFVAEDKTHTTYAIGRLSITPPATNSARYDMNQLLPYELNKPIKIDPLTKLIRPDIEVSMTDLRMYESAGGGFKAAVAKFKLLNRSENPLQVPQFQTALTSLSGNKYVGTRQSTQVDTLIPNISYVIYYSFIIPNAEASEQLAMEITDGKSVEPYHLPLAAFKTKIIEETDDMSSAFYPFQATLNDWTRGVNYSMGGGSLPYAYKMNLDFTIKLQDEIVVDQSFSKMRVEFADEKNRIMASKVFSFTGENKLVSGTQTVEFSLDRLETTVYIRIYEMIDTPFGEARRLIQTLKR
ncbi:hypothetical protein ACFPES_05810 [Paenibacillus sp. GCM10023248]|uniref:hypothetical protein n=1 Tax=Bacillales TaxID=1385 RepID=UPI0023799A82|nr:MULTISPECIES: hypothetical protein [Bacillales]MDD9266546.1 hypothetical protein [Paenibacillus sp. MAHUQ-63]MDR6878675.1 hypothetical protein [Bacillus sp. 3255]